MSHYIILYKYGKRSRNFYFSKCTSVMLCRKNSYLLSKIANFTTGNPTKFIRIFWLFHLVAD